MIPLLQLILFLAVCNVAQSNPKFVGNVNDDEGGTITILDIQDDNKTQYLNQNFEQGNYNYGYDIKPSGPVGQFHHENKSPDDIVYGCYGYEGADSKNYMTFYISDAWGYRPVTQESDVEVFYPADNPEGTGHMNGRMIRWADLVFPEMCAHFAERIASSTNVVTKAPLQLPSPPAPASVTAKLQTTAASSPPVPVSGPSSTAGSSIQTTVPSNAFDVIQFNKPTGTTSTPFSRLTSITNERNPFPEATGNTGAPVTNQPLRNTNRNTPTGPAATNTFPNRFGFQSTRPTPSPTQFNSGNRPSQSSGTGTGTVGPTVGANSGNTNAPSPATTLSHAQFSNSGRVTPSNAPSPANRPFSSPIPSTSNPVSLGGVQQSSKTRQPSTLSSRPAPTSPVPSTPSAGSDLSNVPTPTKGETNKIGVLPSSNTGSPENTRFPSGPSTGFSSRFTASNQPQTSSPFGTTSPARTTSTPTGPSKFETNVPNSPSSTFSRTTAPNRSAGSTQSLRPVTTATPRSDTSRNSYSGDNDDSSFNAGHTGTGTTGGTRNPTGTSSIGSRFPTTTTNVGGRRTVPVSTNPSPTSPGDQNTGTASTPSLSNAEGSTTFLLPNRNTGTPGNTVEGPNVSRVPSSSQGTDRPFSSTFQNNNRGNTNTNRPTATSNPPSATSPFRRPSSSFFNNPSTLQPSSTNQNTIPTNSNHPTSKQPGSDNFRVTDRSNVPTIPQEPELGVTSQQPATSQSNNRNTNRPVTGGFNQGSTQTGTPSQASPSRQPTTQTTFGARRPTTQVPTEPPRSPPAHSSTRTTGSRQSFTPSPLLNTSQDSFCETQCSSCTSSNNKNTVRDEDFSQIPGAILSNIPVIFYPDCSANAYSRPAIVPFCPSQASQCGDQGKPLTMKFPDSANFIAGHESARKARRGRQPRSL